MTENFPSWWQQAICIEYLSCRDYSKGERIGEIDFSLVSAEQLAQALKDHSIVAYGQIVHNVNQETFRSRNLLNLLSGIAKPIVDGDKEALIPHGIVSKYHFPWLTNPVNVVDPIEDFNSHIQVFDNGTLYQWEIARFEGVEGRHYGRWVSDYVDLEGFDETYDDFQALILLKHRVGGGSEEYQKEADAYITRLRKLREEAFSVLLGVHEDLKKRHQASIRKVVQYQPPVLSHFETMQVENGEISTVASMAPMFYRASLKHSRASDLVERSNPVNAFVLDQVYEERAQALVMAAACLEAVVNEVGSAKYAEIWGGLEKLTILDKWMMLCRLSEGRTTFDPSSEPFQAVAKIVAARNDMMHFKPVFRRVTVLKNKGVSKIEMTLNKEVVERLSQVLPQAIREIHAAVDAPAPAWLTDQPGWKVSGDS